MSCFEKLRAISNLFTFYAIAIFYTPCYFPISSMSSTYYHSMSILLQQQTLIVIICLYFTRRFFCPMTSFRNITQFLKELSYNNDSTLRKYSIQVSNVTLDKLLTGLANEIDVVEDDQINSAVYIIGKNTNS